MRAGEPPVERLAPDHVVHRQHARAGGRQQAAVDSLERQPLEVAHVRAGAAAAIAEHVRHVLRELDGAAAARRACRVAGGQPVEGLAHRVALGLGGRAVDEAGRDELHVGSQAGEGAREGVVVGEHVPEGSTRCTRIEATFSWIGPDAPGSARASHRLSTLRAPMTRPLVRWVFALLAVATIAAFFATQQLKSEPALVLRFAAKPAYISPNADDTRDLSEVGFDLSESASVTFSIVDSRAPRYAGSSMASARRGTPSTASPGTVAATTARVVPDGVYRMRVVRRDESRVINSSKEITVDTEPPRVELRDAEPSVIPEIAPGEEANVRIRYRGPVNQAPEFRVFRTDDRPRPYVVRRFRGDDTRSARLARRGLGRPGRDRARARGRLRVHRHGPRPRGQPGGRARGDPLGAHGPSAGPE